MHKRNWLLVAVAAATAVVSVAGTLVAMRLFEAAALEVRPGDAADARAKWAPPKFFDHVPQPNDFDRPKMKKAAAKLAEEFDKAAPHLLKYMDEGVRKDARDPFYQIYLIELRLLVMTELEEAAIGPHAAGPELREKFYAGLKDFKAALEEMERVLNIRPRPGDLLSERYIRTYATIRVVNDAVRFAKKLQELDD